MLMRHSRLSTRTCRRATAKPPARPAAALCSWQTAARGEQPAALREMELCGCSAAQNANCQGVDAGSACISDMGGAVHGTLLLVVWLATASPCPPGLVQTLL